MTFYEIIYCNNCGTTILFDEQTSIDVWGGPDGARYVKKIRDLVECCDDPDLGWNRAGARLDENCSGIKVGDVLRLFNTLNGTWDCYLLVLNGINVGLLPLSSGELPDTYKSGVIDPNGLTDGEINELLKHRHFDTTKIQRVSMTFSDIPDEDVRKDRMDIIVEDTKSEEPK